MCLVCDCIVVNLLYKQIMKCQMERRRREKINSSLEELRSLVIRGMNMDVRYVSCSYFPALIFTNEIQQNRFY